MRVEDALGLVGGAGGVAERGGQVFVELRPFVVGGFGRQQGFVVAQVGQIRLRGQVLRPGQQHPAFHFGAVRSQLLDQGQKRQIKEQEPVFGVVDDVDELLGEQARVDGVADRAAPRNAVVQLQVAVGVPGQGPDSVAGLDAQLREGIGQLFGPLIRPGVVRAVPAAFGQPRHDFGGAVPAGGVAEQPRDEQRLVHHESLHSGRYFTQCFAVLNHAVFKKSVFLQAVGDAVHVVFEAVHVEIDELA